MIVTRRNRYQLILMLPAVLTANLMAACGVGDTEATHGGPVNIEDSAGVRIVEYVRTPVAVAPYVFPAEPRYRHGTKPGDYEFQGINVGRLFPDGSAVVADLGHSEVVVLSPEGTTHEVLARRGEGPGETIYPYSLFVLGQDSVLVPDNRQSRLTLFVGDSVARIAGLPRVGHIGVAGIGSSGELMLINRTPYRSLSDLEEEWLTGHMSLYDTETGALDTVAAYDHWPRVPPGLPWNPIAPVGEVTVVDGQFVYTRSDRPEITWSLPDGTVTQIVRWRAEPTRLTEELLEPVEAFERMVNQVSYPHLSDSGIEEYTREGMSWYHAMIGQPMPLFGAPFADAVGNVWLPSYRLAYPEEGSPYTVISTDGEWLGTVTAPPRLRILDVAGRLVLGVLRDETDVQSVVVYELVGIGS